MSSGDPQALQGSSGKPRLLHLKEQIGQVVKIVHLSWAVCPDNPCNGMIRSTDIWFNAQSTFPMRSMQ